MTLHESEFTPEKQQTYSFVTALLLGEAVQVNNDVVFMFDKRKRYRVVSGNSTNEKVIYITRPASQKLHFGYFDVNFPELSTEQPDAADVHDTDFLYVKGDKPVIQVGQGYRINLNEAITPDGLGLVLQVESLSPLKHERVSLVSSKTAIRRLRLFFSPLK